MNERESALALYTYLKEFANLRTRKISDVSSYEQVIWADDIPRERGCKCIMWHRDDPGDAAAVWIEVRKPHLTTPPRPPDRVEPWVQPEQLADSSLELPELRPTCLGASAEDSRLILVDHPEVVVAWEAYIENDWWPWAEQDRREQKVQAVYTDLFSMFQRQQRLGELFEIVFGFGLLSWTAPNGNAVRRHLIVARVSVAFDSVDGTLTVSPAGDGAHPMIEQDMVDPQYRPDPETLRTMEATLEEIEESLVASGPLDGLLKSWVNSVSAEGAYSGSLAAPERTDEMPVVHLAPALIMRARTDRSYIRAYDDIIAELNAGGPIPEGVSRFINVSQDQTRAEATSSRGKDARPSELFFPLPANAAQKQIVERLTTNQGVLVQGPPGTGKSHTIVNLICHALATGQRVLVTSHAVRALKVLQRKIRDEVPDLAPLAVVLLGDDREAMLAMEESVQGITSREATWDEAASEETIAQHEIALDTGRKRQAEVSRDLRAIREQETYQHDAQFGYAGTLAQIAGLLHEEREALSWIPDDIEERREPPLTSNEFGELVALLNDGHVSHWHTRGRDSINLDRLPTAAEFERAVQVEDRVMAAYHQEAPIRQRPMFQALKPLPEDDRVELRTGLQKLVQRIESIDRRPLPWTETATKEILGDFERTWRQLLDATTEAARAMSESAAWLDENPVSPDPGLDLLEVRADVEALFFHLDGGGGWGWGPFRAEVVKRALALGMRKWRVGGRLCETAEVVADLVRRLDAQIEFHRIRERWAPHHQITSTTFTERSAELADLCEPLEDAFAALSVTEELSTILAHTPETSQPQWADRSELDHWIETLTTFETTQQYETARDSIEQTLEALRAQQRDGNLDQVSEELTTAISDRDAAAYNTARNRAAENRKLEIQLRRRRTLHQKLEGAAPNLAEDLTQAPTEALWKDQASDFESAWQWSRAHAWVTRLADPDAEEQCRLELDNANREIASSLEKLAAEKAWTYCFQRMTENERQHLVAWTKAVRSIGKGTGKHAPRYRRDAREHLNACRSAIPAWVMPLHRVAETFQPGSEPFDIAIIDEASQSGPEALLLTYLAKKIVVVGDDKQIAPEYVGTKVDDVNQLRDRYLKSLPFSDAYGVQQSFFDLAEIRYKGRIRLREHFRCMPEIIQFSNNLSYSGEPLIPMRQYGAGRLEPTVITRHVPAGYQKGTGPKNSVNPPEAEAIVAEITKIHGDPAYEGKTFGVISLVGNAQARLIETRLLRELGPEAIERRQIVCGDANAFQGDERHVIFLSMVSAPSDNRSIPAMTGAAAQRRFNVAASRAQDQLYLFHSATLADLNPSCLRHQLLEYCLEPRVAIPEASGLDVPQLERAAFQADRQRVRPPAPFDSWFELDVFLHIARRGYRVIPQVAVGGYRIDLVVQGMDGSLAVECDGDHWHGPERYEADLARELDLERCGWEFWRVRESVFRLDPEDALQDLWETLERRRVFPSVDGELGEMAGRQADKIEEREEVEAEGIGSRCLPRDVPEFLRKGGAETVEQVTTRENSEDLLTKEASASLPEKGLVYESVEVSGSDPKIEPTPRLVSQPLRNGKLLDDLSPTQDPFPDPKPAISCWPVQQSSDIRPTQANGRPDPALASHVGWAPTDNIPDVGTASEDQLVELLADVVEREGPVIAIRVYRLLNRAGGDERLSKTAKRSFNRACHAAVNSGVLAVTNPLNCAGQQQQVLRIPGRPETVLRERGDRELGEIPPDEIAALLRAIQGADPILDREALKRRALVLWEWGTTAELTRHVNSCLDPAFELM